MRNAWPDLLLFRLPVHMPAPVPTCCVRPVLCLLGRFRQLVAIQLRHLQAACTAGRKHSRGGSGDNKTSDTVLLPLCVSWCINLPRRKHVFASALRDYVPPFLPNPPHLSPSPVPTCPSMEKAAMVRMLVKASEAVWLACAKVSSSCRHGQCVMCGEGGEGAMRLGCVHVVEGLTLRPGWIEQRSRPLGEGETLREGRMLH